MSPDHTERMLGGLGVPVRTVGTLVQLDLAGWDRRLPAFELALPGDPSPAAPLIVAAQLVAGIARDSARGRDQPDAHRPARNRARHGRRARGRAAGRAQRRTGGAAARVERALATRSPSGARPCARAIDELPAACALAARANGTTRIAQRRGVGRERRIAIMAGVLRAFGVTCEERPDGLDVEGREGPLEAADVDSGGDPAVAMTAAVLALAGRAPDPRSRRRLHREQLPQVRRPRCARSAPRIDVE